MRGIGRAAVVAALGLAGVAACTRPVPGTRQRGADTWRWAYSTGGLAGQRVTPEQRKLRIVYIVNRDTTVEVIKQPGGITRTKYVRGPATEASGGREFFRYADTLSILPPPVKEHYVRYVGRDTLVLTDPCADCFEHTFVRIR